MNDDTVSVLTVTITPAGSQPGYRLSSVATTICGDSVTRFAEEPSGLPPRSQVPPDGTVGVPWDSG